MATQHNINGVRIMSQLDRGTGQFAAWVADGDDPIWTPGDTEQGAVNALLAKLYNAELTPETDALYDDFFAGKITVVNCGDCDDEDDQPITVSHSSHDRQPIRQPAPHAKWGRKGK